MNIFVGVFIVLIAIASAGFSEDAQDQRKAIAARALEWLYFDDWGRPKPVDESEIPHRRSFEPSALRKVLQNPNISAPIQPIEAGFAGNPVCIYLFDVKSKRLTNPDKGSVVPKSNHQIRVTITPKGDNLWSVGIETGQLLIGIDVNFSKDAGAYVVDKFTQYLIFD